MQPPTLGGFHPLFCLVLSDAGLGLHTGRSAPPQGPPWATAATMDLPYLGLGGPNRESEYNFSQRRPLLLVGSSPQSGPNARAGPRTGPRWGAGGGLPELPLHRAPKWPFFGPKMVQNGSAQN